MNNDLDSAIGELYPVPAGESAALERVRDRIPEHMGGRMPEDVGGRIPGGTRGRIPGAGRGTAGRRRRWWPHVVSGVAASVLAVAVVAVAVRGGGPDGAMVEVAQTLNTAADAQIRAVDQPIPAGKYRLVATHAMATSWGPGSIYLFGTRTEVWEPADPAGEWFRLRWDTGERTLLAGPGDGITAPVSEGERVSGSCAEVAMTCAGAGSWQQPTTGFVAGLPRDPERLFERLRRDTAGHGQDSEQEVLVYAADALRSGMLPADLRAALYRALTRLPTLKITERVATLDGRSGTALGVRGEKALEQQEIVIEPETGVFIGERKRLNEDLDGVRAGTVTGSSTVTYSIVDEPWKR